MKTLIQLSDCHIVANGLFRGIDPRAHLKQIIKMLPSETDAVVITGDLTQYGDSASYQHLHQLLQPITAPVTVLAGNHDNLEKMSHYLPEYVSCRVDVERWRILLLNSTQSGQESGFLSGQSLKQLDDALNNSVDKHCLIALHHPPISMQSSWDDTKSLTNGEDLLAVLTAHPCVKGVVWGHAHDAKTFHQNGLHLYASPATSVGYGSNKRVGYRKINLYDDGSLTTDIVWMN